MNVDPAFLSHLQVSKEEGVVLPPNTTDPAPVSLQKHLVLRLRGEENTRTVPPRLTGFFRSNCVQAPASRSGIFAFV